MWFKIHKDDLHSIDERKELESIPTRDVKVYIGTCRASAMYYTVPGTFVFVEVMTKTTAEDAFLKSVHLLMRDKKFNPLKSYEISVEEKTVKEPIEYKGN